MGSENNSGEDATTLHVKQAIQGDTESLSWIVQHFHPLLLTEARFRLRRHLQDLYDPEDLVQRVWMITIPRLSHLRPRNGRYTPVLMKFLSTALLQDYRNLLTKHIVGKPMKRSEGSTEAPLDPLAALPAEAAGVLTHVGRNELIGRVLAVIDELPENEREVLVLRGIEQLPYRLVAERVGVEEATLRVRFHRALEALRRCLPAEVVDQLAE